MSTSQEHRRLPADPRGEGSGIGFFSQSLKGTSRSLTYSLQNNIFLLLKILCYRSPRKLIRGEEQDESFQTSQERYSLGS